MPLKPGSSRKVISENIHEMVAAGHPVRQAVAASLHNAHPMAGPMQRAKRDHAAETMKRGVGRMGSHGKE